jgi:hypothetical protein
LDDEIRVQVAQRYVDLYERVAGESFDTELGDEPVTVRIERNIESYFDR